MSQVIYGDVLLLINFSMDYLALYVTAVLLNVKIKALNMAIASALGAIYSLACVAVNKDNIIIAVIVAYIMCFLAFRQTNFKIILKEFVVFSSANFLLGGGMTVVFNVFNSFGNIKEILVYGDVEVIERNLPLTVFCIGFFIIAFILFFFGRVMNRESGSKKILVSIGIFDKSIKVYARVDSGNLIKEPLSGQGVIFITENALKGLLSVKQIADIKSNDIEALLKDNINARILIYETVTGKEMTLCIKPGYISLDNKDVDAWVAISKVRSFGQYEGLVPSSVI